MYDVAIIGAGVVGAMVARTLSRYNLDICILEKENDVSMGASRANSGIVHAGFDAKPESLKAKLNVQGSRMMERVTTELGVKYKNNGSLVIGFDDGDKKIIEELLAQGTKNGVEGLRILDAEELHKIEPGVSRNAVSALYAPTGSIVCPYELTIAAIGNAMDNGAQLRLNFAVRDICQRDGFYEIISDDDRIEARTVINAAGMYADKIANMIGDFSFKLHARRGEYILLDKECGDMVRHTIFKTPSKMGKGVLVTQTVDNNLLVGPTSEDIEDKDDKSTTAEGFARLMREGVEIADDVPFGKMITSFCGLRAVGDTGDFIINSPQKGFVNVAGIESPGLSASPAIALYVEQMLCEQGLCMEENKDYNPYRKPMHHFREASIEEKNEIIKRDKSFGHIVCRCETVTEGEILEAIRTNPKARDLDGVKRRTRAQMGRCQGGFCSPYIVELLAKEMEISYEKVTKCGGESIINMGRTKEEKAND